MRSSLDDHDVRGLRALLALLGLVLDVSALRERLEGRLTRDVET
jgi:hypothetical protein